MSLNPLPSPFPQGFINFLRNIIDGYLIINNEIKDFSELPTVIQNIGIALLTILIPLAIVILTEVYKEKHIIEENKAPFVELDLRVVLDDIFKVKSLIIYALMMFIPLAFWDIWAGSLRLLLVTLSAIGLSLIIFSILTVYRWTKGNIRDIYNFRYSFLKRKDIREIVNIWKSVWICEKILLTFYEIRFFRIFSYKIDQILQKQKMDKNDLAPLQKLIEDFSNNVEKRSTLFVTIDRHFLPKMLEWNFLFWKKLRINLKKQDTDEFPYVYTISHYIEKVIAEISQVSVKNQLTHPFFSTLKAHITIYKKEQIQIGEITHCYLEALFKTFSPIFFDERDITDSYHFWESVPNEWKVTFTNITNEENWESKILLGAFLEKFARIIGQNVDSKISRVITFLFPEVNPSKLATILLFSHTYTDDKVKITIERDWRLISYALFRTRPFSFQSGSQIQAQINAQIQSETRSTYDIVFSVSYLRAIFTEELLIEYMARAIELNYPSNAEREARRKLLLEIFEEMWAYLNDP